MHWAIDRLSRRGCVCSISTFLFDLVCIESMSTQCVIWFAINVFVLFLLFSISKSSDLSRESKIRRENPKERKVQTASNEKKLVSQPNCNLPNRWHAKLCVHLKSKPTTTNPFCANALARLRLLSSIQRVLVCLYSCWSQMNERKEAERRKKVVTLNSNRSTRWYLVFVAHE